jgi:cysteinyl-tRNA synthetase
MELVEQRQEVRAEKRWDEADALRDKIVSAGFDIEDTPDGPRVRRRKQTSGE